MLFRPLKRLYSKLVPLSVRDALRPLKTPRQSLVYAYNRWRSGGRVVAGPFAGMSVPGSIANQGMLLGTWERELREVIEEIASLPYRRVVNIGAAEGYYAVGLARRLPQAKIVAFEALADQQACLRELAQANAVSERLEIHGRCETPDLKNALAPAPGDQTLVVMDVEGFEVTLLEPGQIPALEQADLLVECHDLYVEGCKDSLVQRFQSTHEIREVGGHWRTLEDYPFSDGLGRHRLFREQVLFSMNEGRPCLMSWLWMRSRAGT